MLSFFNSKRKPPDHPEHDTLFKVSWAMDLMAEGIRATWNVGKQVTIDESMIRYMGRAVEYIQYMPAKPIKHGIKVWALCCGVTGIMIAWRVRH
jgi:hypothetical protein